MVITMSATFRSVVFARRPVESVQGAFHRGKYLLQIWFAGAEWDDNAPGLEVEHNRLAAHHLVFSDRVPASFCIETAAICMMHAFNRPTK